MINTRRVMTLAATLLLAAYGWAQMRITFEGIEAITITIEEKQSKDC